MKGQKSYPPTTILACYMLLCTVALYLSHIGHLFFLGSLLSGVSYSYDSTLAALALLVANVSSSTLDYPTQPWLTMTFSF